MLDAAEIQYKEQPPDERGYVIIDVDDNSHLAMVILPYQCGFYEFNDGRRLLT